MQAWVLTLAIGAPLALGGGWFTAILPENVSPVAARSNAIPQVDHAGFMASLAKKDFVAMGMPTRAPEQQAVLAAATLVEAVPIEQQFMRDLTAILDQGRSKRVLIVDRDNGNARRELKVGQEFRDGWILKEIRRQEVVLAQAGEQKVVPLFGEAAPAAALPAGDTQVVTNTAPPAASYAAPAPAPSISRPAPGQQDVAKMTSEERAKLIQSMRPPT